LREDLEKLLGTLMKAINKMTDDDILKIQRGETICDQETEELCQVFETEICKLHKDFGERHSVYHFLEYLWICLYKAATAKSISRIEILDQLVEAVFQYKKEELTDKTIYHMPFVGIKWAPVQDRLPQFLDDLFIAGGTQPGSFAQIWSGLVDCPMLADWIITVRDFCGRVLDTGHLSVDDTRRTSLLSLAEEDSSMRDQTKRLQIVLDEISSYPGISTKVQFKKMYLADFTENRGIIRKLLRELVSKYQENISGSIERLKCSKLKSQRLSKIHMSDLFQLRKENLIEKIQDLYTDTRRRPEDLHHAVIAELRRELQNLKEIDDDVSERPFAYSDRRVLTLVGLAQCHSQWEHRPQKLIERHERAKIIQMLKKCTVDIVMRLENDLFGLFKNEDDNLGDDPCLLKSEIELGFGTIKCPLDSVLDLHRLFLLQKLHRINLQYKRLINAAAKNEDVLLGVLDRNNNPAALEANCKFLAAIAENKDESGVLKLICRGQDSASWKEKLINIASIRDAVEEFGTQIESIAELTLADVCAASSKVLDREFHRLA
jgi:hypothetical protein